jgi:hypothetical protein
MLNDCCSSARIYSKRTLPTHQSNFILQPCLVRVRASLQTFQFLQLKVQHLMCSLRGCSPLWFCQIGIARQPGMMTDHILDRFDRHMESFGRVDGVSAEVMKCWKIGLQLSMALPGLHQISVGSSSIFGRWQYYHLPFRSS